MMVLCFNAGSGTLRYRLFDMPREDCVSGEDIDRVKDTEQACSAAVDALDKVRGASIDVIAVRVVHGGEQYQLPTQIDDEVIESLTQLQCLAPLHLPTDIAIAKTVRSCARCPVYAVFDTMFHQTLPDAARYYPLPEPLRGKYRRFGFHGFAHQSVTSIFRTEPRCIGHRGPTARLISVHFGGGVSACAVRDGKSVATTMGMTPLDGLMMSTRCGSIDPGVVLSMIRDGRTADEVDRVLNRESGLLGVSAISDDTRDILPAMKRGDRDAQLAVEMYADRVVQAIGAYFAILGGCDALLISGALVKESPLFRSIVLGNLKGLDIHLDSELNDCDVELSEPTRLSRSGVTVAFIPADEELQMARSLCSHSQ